MLIAHIVSSRTNDIVSHSSCTLHCYITPSFNQSDDTDFQKIASCVSCRSWSLPKHFALFPDDAFSISSVDDVTIRIPGENETEIRNNLMVTSDKGHQKGWKTGDESIQHRIIPENFPQKNSKKIVPGSKSAKRQHSLPKSSELCVVRAWLWACFVSPSCALLLCPVTRHVHW